METEHPLFRQPLDLRSLGRRGRSPIGRFPPSVVTCGVGRVSQNRSVGLFSVGGQFTGDTPQIRSMLESWCTTDMNMDLI